MPLQPQRSVQNQNPGIGQLLQMLMRSREINNQNAIGAGQAIGRGLALGGQQVGQGLQQRNRLNEAGARRQQQGEQFHLDMFQRDRERNSSEEAQKRALAASEARDVADRAAALKRTQTTAQGRVAERALDIPGQVMGFINDRRDLKERERSGKARDEIRRGELDVKRGTLKEKEADRLRKAAEAKRAADLKERRVTTLQKQGDRALKLRETAQNDSVRSRANKMILDNTARLRGQLTNIDAKLETTYDDTTAARLLERHDEIQAELTRMADAEKAARDDLGRQQASAQERATAPAATPRPEPVETGKGSKRMDIPGIGPVRTGLQPATITNLVKIARAELARGATPIEILDGLAEMAHELPELEGLSDNEKRNILGDFLSVGTYNRLKQGMGGK